MGFLQRKRMNLFKFVFVFVLFAPVCLTVQQALQLDQLKTDLLTLLEVKEKPTVSRSRYQVPRYVIDLYRRQAFIDGFTKNGTSPGTTIRTFFRRPKDKRGPHKHLFTFNVTAIRTSEKIAHAELHIFKRRSRLRRPRGFFEVVVSRLFQPWQKRNKRWKRKMEAIDTKLIKCRRVGEWMKFNITTAVKYWAKYPSKNFGLWISVRGKNAPPSDFHVATGGRKDPFVVEYGIDRERLQKAKEIELKENTVEKKNDTKDEGVEASHQSGHNKVNKDKKDLSVHTRSRRSTSNVCKRHRLFVKFKDLTWDNWIIAPKGFSMYYCNGACPEVIQKYFDPTNHAIIQNLLHHRFSKTIPAACCVPTKLHSITMLYFEMDGSIVLKEYAEMVAESCGCR